MDYGMVLDLIEQKARQYGTDTARCVEIRQGMNTFEVCVVVIGAFSAGKSAMLNTFLKRDILSEGQRPETALASELVYDTSDYVEAFSNGQVKTMTPAEARSLNVDQYDYLRWHLRNEALAGIPGYTLVDMPGFNSGIQAHNKALLRYVDRAAAYLLVIDVEDGGVKQSMGDFLREIRNYEHNLAIVVSKCNLKSAETAAEVAENIKRTAEMIFRESVPVIQMGRDDVDGTDKLTNLIEQFDRNELCRQRFLPMVQVEGESLIHLLELKKNGAKLDESGLQAEIAKREKAKKDLERALRGERAKLMDQYGYQDVASIMGQVETALSDETSSLAASLKSGGNAFSARVNSILRPVLVNAVKDFTDQSFEDLVGLVNMN